ncbi:MAG: HAMP domain-containing sensor histidine kinase [Bacteroidales bacterium]|jgi:signal transduction histidine kinase|nr:HAMP domain-containing sensor histidine kinase [Bacteroidales bacterium]
MNPNSPGFSNWKTEIETFIQKSHTLAIAIYRQNGELVYSNPAFIQLIKGNEKETLLNPTFNDLVNATEKRKHVVFEGYLTIGNLTVNQSINSIVYRKNNELLIVGEVEIDELKKLNLTMIELNREINNLQRQLIKEKKQLADANKKLNLLNQEKNRILGIAAHDLRNPIGTILGYTQLLSNRFEKISSDEINKFLSVIINSSNFSLNLLNDLLDISKIESGKVLLNYSKINYIDFVKTIIGQNQIIARQKEITITLQQDTEDFIARIDSQKIEQVLNNLISNSIKYSGEGSTIFLRLSISDNFFKTEVIDQGQGIPKEDLPEIFNPFQTSSVKSTAGEKSTGLGLAITKKIIKEHGGIIDVVSEQGKGSNFYFVLPM